MKQIPVPLHKKMAITALAGSGCMLFGLIYFIAAKDRIFLLLSAAVFLNCAWRAYSIYRIAVKGTYEVIEGTCVRINPQLIGKFRTVIMMDDGGIESTFRLAKNLKLKIGERYRLYFDNRNQYKTGSGFFDKALATGNFLGCESAPAAVIDGDKNSERQFDDFEKD